MPKSVKRLVQSFIPTHYDLEITPDADVMHFSGRVTISGKKTGRPSQRLTFHQYGLKVTSATITRKDKKGAEELPIDRINHHKTLHEVRLHSERMLYPGEYTVTMEFEAPITRNMTGLYPCFFKHDGKEKKLLATQFESHHAREMFPCIDEPEAKATFDLSLVHDKSLTALGNNPVAAQKELQGGLVRTTFETTPKMSTYLLAFVLGEIHSVSAKTKSGVEVNVWGTVAQPKDSFQFALDTAVKSIEFFEDYFGVPYPLPKADHIALPDFTSGAMENWGLITYREVALLLYPGATSQSSKEWIGLVIAHETSHQWFGNLVTMKWWDDLWLNESFASVMEYVCLDALFPEWHVWESFVTADGLSALRRDAVPGVQAVRCEVHHPDEISTLFDPSIVYAKGGRLLYMLKNYVGEDDWRKGLTAYFKKHAYGNTRGADLWAALSEASGKDIAAFMNPWLERSGFPVISLDQKGKSLHVTQEHFLDDRSQADPDRVWPVPLFTERDDVPYELSGNEANAALNDDTFVLVNQQSRGHYLVQYQNADHRNYLAERVKTQELGTIDRLMLLTNSNMLARAGYTTYDETLQLLEAYAAENTEPVWDIMALIIGDTKRFIDHDESLEAPLKDLLKSLVQQEYKRLGWVETPDESSSDQKLRGTILGLGVYAGDPLITKEALDKYQAYWDDQQVVSAELRGILFSAAVKHKVDGAIDKLLKLYADSNNSDLQRDVMGGLTATRDTATASMLLERIKDPKNVKPQDADRWLIYLLRNRYVRDTSWQWMEDNWQWILDTYEHDKSYDNFPRYAAAACSTREHETRYRKFFEPKLNETALKRNISIGFEEIKSRIAWLERDLPAVQGYFKK